MKWNPLTTAEEDVIVRKQTEAPHTGEYDAFSQAGLYTCRRCSALLYRSEDKFDAHCGWPSFDDEILGAVKQVPDADGLRTEILCARCDAHLGHLFRGEQLTPKDTRHCVNAISMKFVPAEDRDVEMQDAYFGGGCFWCTEATFQRVRGVVAVMPGYAGGTSKHPTYEEVSSRTTGHAEVVRITYDPTVIAYEGLLTVFFASHDPTTLDRQGNDLGTQYRSIILSRDETERESAVQFIARLEQEEIFVGSVVTEVKPLDQFYEAEEYHRDYFAKNPLAAYCQAIITPKLATLSKGLEKYFKQPEEAAYIS